MRLKEVDRVEVTILIDNSIDLLLPSEPNVRRALLSGGPWVGRSNLIAEHGFSALIKVYTQEHNESIIFDAGLSEGGLAHNLDVLGVKANEAHCVVLSHGHADHTTGLIGIIKKLGQRKMPVLLHPDAFLERKVVLPDGHEIALPPPDSKFLAREGIELIEQTAPSYIIGGLALVSGEIHRSTDFETGFPIHYAKRQGEWTPDPLIHDDQAIIVHLKGKGLVILTGCGHAGVINTVKHAQAITGVRDIHAILGGFHLTGKLFQDRIQPTVAALKEFNPKVIVPGHCTGWRAIHSIAAELPDAFKPSSVGSTFIFSA